MQGIILAAGMGSRISPKCAVKCLIEINKEKLIKRQIDTLIKAEIKRIIIVCGYKKEVLQRYVRERFKNNEIIFVENNDYKITNNIYSLYLARNYLKQDDTILLESDLIFEYSIIEKIVKNQSANVAAVSKYRIGMDGTVITKDKNNIITAFYGKENFNINSIEKYYKTINIYKLNKTDCINYIIPCMEEYINNNKKDKFYEMVFKDLVKSNKININAEVFENEKWYEVDNQSDLEIAKTIFEGNMTNYEQRYGGYWNFSNLKDFSYLENPKFPTKEILEKMKYFSKELITRYPSGRNIQNINAARLFHVNDDEIIVGNGSAELIKEVAQILEGKITVQIPVFNEYVRCFNQHKIIKNDTSVSNYIYGKNEIIKYINKSDVVTLVNPDNPTGNFINYNDMIDILEEAKKCNKTIIVDESFIDFADKEKRYTLIDHQIMKNYKNLIVIKSISKSYGVPGIRLGVLATSNKKILEKLKSNLSIWNINSIAEYFLQIVESYTKEYEEACDYIQEQRDKLYNWLSEIDYLQVHKSQANYFMCKLLKYDNKYIEDYLLNNYNILIKDLKNKEGFNNENYIRITIKSEEDNIYLVNALKSLEKSGEGVK